MAFMAGAAMLYEAGMAVEGLMGLAGAATELSEAAVLADLMETGVATEEIVPLMQAAEGRTVGGAAVRAFNSYATGSRAITRAMTAGLGLVGGIGASGALSAVSNRGLGKRKRVDPPAVPPLLPAHPARPSMPGRKTPSKRSKAVTKGKRKPSKGKAKKRKSTKKAVKKKRNGPSKSLLAAYETHGIIQRDGVSYFGFQNTGGRDELFRSAMESVLKSLLRKFRIQIRSPDETLNIAQSVPSVDKFSIYSRKRNYSSGADDGLVGDDFDLNAATYTTLVADMVTKIKARVEAGHFPYFLRYYNNASIADSSEVGRDSKFGDCKLSLGVSMKIKLRNITPNDGNGTDRFALDTNPLQGYVYKFAGDTPVVREGLYSSSVSEYAKFHDRECTSCIAFGPQRNANADHDGTSVTAAAIMGANKILSVPPRNGKKIWTNCVSSSAVSFGPGQTVEHRMKFGFNGTLINFLMKYYEGTYAAPKLGVCHWLGLEQKFKQKTKAAEGLQGTSDHEHVLIEYDMDVRHSGGASFAAAAQAPRTVITVAAHNSVAA
jgi:hypothetical protein